MNGKLTVRKLGAPGGAWFFVLLLLVVIYLLSPGIYWAAVARGGATPNAETIRFLDSFYKPISWLSQWKPIGEFYGWYFRLCTGI